jgi:hypothetical protein
MSTSRRGVAIIVAAAALAGGSGFYALHRSGAEPVAAGVLTVAAPPVTASPGTVIAAPGLEGATRGAIEHPAVSNVVADALSLSGWADDPAGIARVDVMVDDQSFAAQQGLAHAATGTAAAPSATARDGFAFQRDFAHWPLERHALTVIATNGTGQRTALGERSLVSPDAMSLWSGALDASPALADRAFQFLLATSGLPQGGAREADTQYAGLASRTQRIGISVPILYMRATRGAAGDWAFDPGFDLSRRCENRPVVDDNLDEVIGYAIARRIRVNFILNGGIWADASCYSGEWDLTTHLELDPAHCQWDQFDAVLPGDYRRGLVGSTASPQLSRSLTYNVYDRSVRAYKRRNLAAAARIVAQFAREHPDLFVGVSLDADTYMNPFVEGGHHYDYNPGMLRQFREWLAGTGPYAGRPRDGAPDLREYRRAKPLSLADVNRLAHAHWRSWSDVQPPRRMPGYGGAPVAKGETPFWQDRWYREWDTFRKHIVQLHYAELAQWAQDAGIPADRIFTAQAVTPHDPGTRAVATYVTSPPQLYDSAGVSIEGAKPPAGHIGVILYGPAAENAITMETGHNLFATIGRFDDAWAVAEMNATDLRRPTVLPTYAQSYHAFRDLFNYGARQVSLMAWNGTHGFLAGRPGYVAYTSWRGTPAEQAMMDFLVSHADVPRGALLWTFGSPRLAEADGWTASSGTIEARPGALALHAEKRKLVLRSPADLLIRPRTLARAILKFDRPTTPVDFTIRARREGDREWTIVAKGHGPSTPFDWPATWLRTPRIVEQLEIAMTFADDAEPAMLTRVLLYPGQPAQAR